MSRLADAGHKVVYVDPTNLSEAFRNPSLLTGRLEEVEGGIIAARPLFLPLHYRVPALDPIDARSTYAFIRKALRRLDADKPDAVMLSSPFQSFMKDSFKDSLLVYDCVDASEGLCSTEGTKRWYLQREQAIMGRADAVLAVSNGLLDRCVRANPDSYLVPNGVSCLAPAQAVPDDMVSIRHPIIGFAGRLGQWVDIALIRDLAAARPDLSVVLIGPVDTNDGALPELRQMRNVHFLGTRPFSTMASYIGGMDACMIPFKQDILTKMASPVKMFEYASLGKPIVSTPLDGVMEFSELVYASDGTSDGFIDKVDQALGERGDILRQQRMAMAKEHDWVRIAAKVEEVLNNALARREGVSPTNPFSPSSILAPGQASR